ncbi:helix-turn-helix domain-containing protein [Bordetella sp. BOR01]|uniref:helix-turn-helix domain-containing protein n=1 Tax=Bordetella sp. BOR01 TaxID=2854779 RepID=UPI001C46763E|nr:helix-turn-helix domain-containing protein [Bordetella sp. BOR01]MBV7486848.1 helix-turn-helix domain-containing protein [Bordetella sp. BOR01]
MTASMNLVVRTLDVLRALNKQTHCSLRDLHQATGIPKPTVHRLLNTLKNEGYIRSDVVKGVYSLTEKVRLLSDGYTEHDLVVELGAPVLLRTTRQTGLPFAIGVADRSRMVVRYSSMPYSPIAPEHTTIGNSHHMARSAMGLAFLAFCSAAEQERLLHWLSLESTESAWRSAERVLRADIALVRKRGFALRRPDPKHTSATLAVPIRHQGRTLGVLSLTTFPSLLNGAAITDFTELLIRTSKEIGVAVDQHQQNI